MLSQAEISDILNHYGLSFSAEPICIDSSHGERDLRLNYLLDNKYVLKVNSMISMWEERLQEISRLIDRYRRIGLYCPRLIPTLSGSLSIELKKGNERYTCFVEEFSIYPAYGWNTDHERRDVIEHLGILAAKYSNVDLSETRSMWSILDLAPLDVEIDEKQENTNLLTAALQENGYLDLAQRVNRFNEQLRGEIKRVFHCLPRCVFQGDLNPSNELHKDGRFVGLIDFNLSGTEVNINVFVNETQEFPEEDSLDRMSPRELVTKMNADQDLSLAVIFRHYTLNEAELYAFPRYRAISNLFQYPNVCAMQKWLREEKRREACTALIEEILNDSIKQINEVDYEG